MAYYYKQPPMYDEKLSNRVVFLMQFSFILQMLFGYWMYSNQQMFYNNVSELSMANSQTKSGRTIFSSIQIDQSFPFLIVAVLSVILTILVSVMRFTRKVSKSGDFEDLKPYVACLKEYDREWLRSEEQFVREFDEYKLLQDRFYRTLVTSNALQIPNALTNKNYIQNVASYDILMNPMYEERFQYFPAQRRGEMDQKLFMSEKVRKLLYLPYLSPNQIKEFEFSNHLLSMF